MAKIRIVIFAKLPAAGFAKTRLIPALPPQNTFLANKYYRLEYPHFVLAEYLDQSLPHEKSPFLVVVIARYVKLVAY